MVRKIHMDTHVAYQVREIAVELDYNNINPKPTSDFTDIDVSKIDFSDRC